MIVADPREAEFWRGAPESAPRKVWEKATQPTDDDVAQTVQSLRQGGKTDQTVVTMLRSSIRDGRLYPNLGESAAAEQYTNRRARSRCMGWAHGRAWELGLSRSPHRFQPTPLAERVAKALVES